LRSADTVLGDDSVSTFAEAGLTMKENVLFGLAIIGTIAFAASLCMMLAHPQHNYSHERVTRVWTEERPLADAQVLSVSLMGDEYRIFVVGGKQSLYTVSAKSTAIVVGTEGSAPSVKIARTDTCYEKVEVNVTRPWWRLFTESDKSNGPPVTDCVQGHASIRDGGPPWYGLAVRQKLGSTLSAKLTMPACSKIKDTSVVQTGRIDGKLDGGWFSSSGSLEGTTGQASEGAVQIPCVRKP
jgi:hypothetical protein